MSVFDFVDKRPLKNEISFIGERDKKLARQKDHYFYWECLGIESDSNKQNCDTTKNWLSVMKKNPWHIHTKCLSMVKQRDRMER